MQEVKTGSITLITEGVMISSHHITRSTVIQNKNFKNSKELE